jgi:amino acid adenylation domain-containing protein
MNELLVSGFFKSWQARPESFALVCDGQTLSYDQLAHQAAPLRTLWRDSDPARPIGIWAYRSIPAYAGAIAALMAGRGYMPLSPLFPAERTRYMLDCSGTSDVLLDRRCEDGARQVLAGVSRPLRVVLAQHDQRPVWCSDLPQHRFLLARDVRADRMNEEPAGTPEGLAYLLFTSGSTGRPKGVMVSNRNAASYMRHAMNYYRPEPGDRFSQSFDMTFDLSVHDLFLCWTGGASLHVIPERSVMAPARFIREEALTFWFSVPSTAGMMHRFKMLKPGAFPSLKWSLFCGEPLTAQAAQAWADAAPHSILENLYGPTEATIAITRYRWGGPSSLQECHNGVVPIGHPFPGQEAMVVDGSLNAVDAGQAGELCLGGSQVTPGYWENPAETTSRFVTLAGQGPGRWYRTGDLARWSDVGLLYLGRLDHQIKIRGHRVEMQEIEHVIRQAAGTPFVAVIGWPLTPAGADGVIAFLSGSQCSPDAVAAACRRQLPDYMVVHEVHFIEHMPLNANGKTDYRKLAEIRRTMDGTAGNKKLDSDATGTGAAAPGSGEARSG